MFDPVVKSEAFEIKSVRQQACFLGLLNALAVCAIAISNLEFGLQWVLSLLVLFCFFYQYRHVQKAPAVILSYSHNLGWAIGAATERKAIEILPSTVVVTWLVVIQYRSENSKVSAVVCFADALPSRRFKRLQVLLKINGLADSRNL